jgi:TonB family protein
MVKIAAKYCFAGLLCIALPASAQVYAPRTLEDGPPPPSVAFPPDVRPDGGSDPKVIGNPARWITSDDYPDIALKMGLDGRAQIKLNVSETGSATSCIVIQSSGVQMLDVYGCTNAVAFAKFTPATNPKGKAIAGSFTQGIRWALPMRRDDNRKAPQPPFYAPTPIGDAEAWITKADAPPDNRMAQISAYLYYRLAVSETGSVTKCTPLHKKGMIKSTPLQDRAICALLTARAKFRPAMTEDWQPVAGRFVAHASWTMNPGQHLGQ